MPVGRRSIMGTIYLSVLFVIMTLSFVAYKRFAPQEEVIYETQELSDSEMQSIINWRTHLLNRILQYVANLYNIEDKDIKDHFSVHVPKVDCTLALFVYDLVEIEIFFNWEDGIFEAQFMGCAENNFKKKRIKLKLTDAGIDDLKFLKFLVKTYNYYYEDDE